ncbi:competence type IV pilus ATPase ComGA [Alkalibacillus haloalkaliphilus]|uniref:competence type IV pilus ATPase ComGA n=1 Tax=Alkalibacillus haloalkaliphilus TaxID=94136 RepID=UPI0002F9EF3D|nr:competence type IV pilus ATPase ComGA [Alkalibacillus haloalkaliphilus]
MKPDHLSNHIIHDAIQKGATDVHFSPEEVDVTIHFRINGYRWFYKRIPLTDYQTLLSYYKFTSGMDIAENRIPQDGTIPLSISHDAYHLRLSTLPLTSTESLAIRILPKNKSPTINELFLFPKQTESLLNWIQNKAGIILFTGPTGSGKSSTMFALMKEAIKRYGYQTISLEDPIERDVDQILQVQVNEKAGFSYDVGLKAALRHDPDIITVGEVRDEATAQFAFRAALTGHLVLTTVHAKNAHGTIERLLEMGLTKTELHQTIIGIAAQQLIPLSNTLQEQRGYSRLAIAELLEGESLTRSIKGFPPENNSHFYTFHQLRRKAYAYGYSTQSY